MSSTTTDVARLLAPRSIVVIGASDKPGNLGADTVRRLQRFKFPGPVWPVNRSCEPVAGLKAYASVSDLPGVPDLAILAIPAEGLSAAVRDCVAGGIKFGVAYAGGLAESGRADGIELQRELVATCRELGFTMCGPNCVGYINTAVPVTATFATALHEVEVLPAGSISLVSQSGGIATTAMSIILEAGFGIRTLISGGNEVTTTFADYIEALAHDDGTRVIGAYLEGVQDGQALAHSLGEAKRRGKPVVMIKSGATQASARAALAHTGSLVGEERVFDAVLKEHGVIRVQSVEEMVDVCLLLASIPADRMPRSTGVGIITFGGGNGVLAADQAERCGLSVPQLEPETVARLRPLLVSVASAANPVDLTPSTAFRPEALAQLPAAIRVVADDPSIGSLMFIAASLGSKAREIGDIMIDLHRNSPKPVCVCWSSPPSGVLRRLAENGVAAFVEPARGMRALGLLAAREAAVSRPTRAAPVPVSIDWRRHVPEVAGVVTEDRCHVLLRECGLDVARGRLARNSGEAVAVAREIGLPVVLKGISAAVTHRAAAGLLAVDLRSEAEVSAAFDRLSAHAAASRTSMDGFYVQAMAKGGSELLVAAFRDPLFGPMVTVGVGGGLTEMVDDVVTRSAPISEAGAVSMIAGLRSASKLLPNDMKTDHAAAFIARFSQLTAEAPWDRFTFEVNPVKWTAERAVAVDGLLVIET
jgi:acyl-CoA synthetase (NDP forming)